MRHPVDRPAVHPPVPGPRARRRILHRRVCSRVGTTLTSRGSVTVTGDGQAADWEATGGQTGTINEYVGPTYTPAAGERLVVRVTVPVQTHGNHVLHLTGLAVSDYPQVWDADSFVTGPDTASSFVTLTGDLNKSKLYRRTLPALGATRHTLSGGAEATFNRAEFFCAGPGQQTRLTLPTQPVTDQMRRSGFTVTMDVAARNRLAVNLAQLQPQVQMVAEGLAADGTVAQTWSGTQIGLNLAAGRDVLGAFSRVGAGADTLPAAVVSIRAYLQLVAPLSGQTVEAGQIMFADRFGPVTATWFDGGHGGVWTGTANASDSVLQVTGPTAYRVDRGVIRAPAAGELAVTVDASEGSQPTIGVQVGSRPAGLHRAGVRLSAGTNGRLFLEAHNGAQVVGTAFLGTVLGTADLSRLDSFQAVVDAAQPFDTVRVRFVPDGTAGALVVRVGPSYCYSVAESKVDRISGNLVSNPVAALGSAGWQSTSAAPVSVTTTTFGTAFQRAAGMRSTRPFPVAAGDKLWLWARVQTDRAVAVRVEWRNAAAAVLSTTTAGVSAADTRYRTVSGFATAPAGAVTAVVTVDMTNAVAGSSMNVYGVFAGADPGGRDYVPSLDPVEWIYFDGRSTADYRGTAVRWDGPADASTSSTAPAVPVGWQNTGVASLAEPRYRPPGSTGKVVAFPGFANAVRPPTVTTVGQFSGFTRGFTPQSSVAAPPPADQTLVGRTIPIPVPNPFLSGEVSLARVSLSSSVTVKVYSCDDAAGTGAVVQFSQEMKSDAEVITWRDLGIGGDYAYLEVVYAETEPNPTFAVMADNVAMVSTPDRLVLDYPGYFDGSSPSAAWQGAADKSPSINYAGARRCYAEFPEPIPPESMAGGTRAEFEATGVVPAACWEDVAESRTVGDTSDPDTDLELTEFAGSTFRNTSTKIRLSLVQGTAPSAVVLSDKKTGSWVQVAHQLLPGDVVTLDCARFKVDLLRNGKTSSLVTQIARGGSSPLLPLTPFSLERPPVLRLQTADDFDGVLHVEVTGRRKFVIA